VGEHNRVQWNHLFSVGMKFHGFLQTNVFEGHINLRYQKNIQDLVSLFNNTFVEFIV